MRVLLSTWGGRGDVEPMVGLAAQLRARDAEVRACAPPDADFERRLADVGVDLVPVGPSARVLATAKPGTASIPDTAKAIVAGQFEALPAAAEGCDVVVATGALPAAAGALSVAEKLGIPAVSVTFQQLTLPSPDRRPLAYPGRPLPDGADPEALWAFDRESIELLFGEALNANRTAHGLDPVDVRDHVITDRPWLATDPVLDPWSGDAGLDVVQTGAWIQPDPRPLPPELLAFLDAGAPPVYVGFGSMPMHAATDPAEEALAAIRAHGRRAILMSGWAGLTPEDGAAADCFVLPEVNQQALFPRVATVVHHGGAGTTTAATRSGTPQVVVPQAVDQPYWAQRVAELGVGVAHDGPAPTSTSLAEALQTTLSPATRARATAVGGMVRLDGTAEAARLLLDR